MSLITLPIITFVTIIILSSCKATTPEPLFSKTPEFTETQVQTSTSTSTFVPMIKPSPSPTLEPYGTPIIAQTIVEGSNLFQLIDIPVSFEKAVEDFPAGFYIILRAVDAEYKNEELMLASIDSDQQERLLMINEILNLEHFYFSMGKAWIVGGYPGTALRYLIDLTNQKTLQFTICHERHPVELSPSGNRLALICSNSEGIQGGKVLAEVISLIDETNIHLEIPYHSDTRSASNSIYWVSDESFIALVGQDEEPCLISIPDQGMRCAQTLRGKPILGVSPSGTWLLVNRSHGATWIKDVHLIECFDNENKCEPVITLDDEPRSSGMMYWSPDEKMLGVVLSAGLGTLTSEIGYYDTDTWVYHSLATLSGDYLFVDWCPDSSCILVRENAKTSSYIIFVDGSLKQLALDGLPLQFIEMP